MKCPHCTLGIGEAWKPGGTIGWDGTPAEAKARRDAYNLKLAEAGKPPLKTPPP